jgi:hypothetical protein
MKESEEFKDDLIKEAVKMGARSLPNTLFEDQMMLKIKADENCKAEVSTQLKLSVRFFVGAMLTGALLALVVLFGGLLGEYNVKTISILSLFAVGVIGVLNMDNYSRLISKFSR